MELLGEALLKILLQYRFQCFLEKNRDITCNAIS
jgi:hypothetical protein